jgi:hypothetical protein
MVECYRKQPLLTLVGPCRWRIHYLSLRSGDPHPLAADFCLSNPPLAYRRPAHLQLIVARNYVAALIPRYQLTVCDWKTGQTVLVRPGTSTSHEPWN